MAFSEDLTVFFDVSAGFAVAATYKAGGTGTGVTRPVIFDRNALLQLDVISGNTPVALGIAADFSGAGTTDTLTINGTVYRITDLQAQDDGALVLMPLVKVP
jgi:hypothetical protein